MGGGKPHARRLLLCAVLLTGGCATERLPPEDALGFRAGGGLFDGAEFDRVEDWLGTEIRYTVQFAGRQSARDMNGSVFGLLVADEATLPQYAHRVDLSLTVPLAFGTTNALTREGRNAIGDKLIATASGEHDDAYQRLARRLVEAGFGDAIVRLGHEFNGSWAPWSSRTNEEAFVAAWRHVHEVLLTEAPELRFEWTAIRPAWFEWGEKAYPGDEFVDIVGLDIYWRVQDNQAIWDPVVWERQYLRTMRDHRSFAMLHGKPIAYPEWAVVGADAPQFVEAMHEWLSNLPVDGPGRLMYHSYFDGNGRFDLDELPRSAATYRELFGD